MRGAAGYSDEMESGELLKRAVESILKGDIWIRRSLVPKVIEALTNLRPFHGAATRSTNIDELIKLFETLSAREVEVAEMIQIGENNKRIASVLNITERTVKAHLSSIFKKLNVDDRLHLAIFLKEIEQYRKKNNLEARAIPFDRHSTLTNLHPTVIWSNRRHGLSSGLPLK